MSRVGIFPAPGGSDEGYVELGATPQGRRFSKHILTIGRQFVHPKTGKPITLGEDAWQQMKSNFDAKRITPIVQFPIVGADNRHTESPLANAGECVDLIRDGDKVIAVIDVRDEAIAAKVGSTILGASAMLHLDARDPQTAERAGVALLHVAATNRPALVDLDDYAEVVAASAEAFDILPDGSVLAPSVLMLCASEADVPEVMLSPDNSPRPDSGRHPMPYASTYDRDRDEIGRLGLQAQRLSSGGRGTKPEYDHARIEAEREESASLSAAAVTEADCTGAALELSARAGGRASFGDIMSAARELAFSRDEATAKEPASLAAALADLAGRLGGTDDPDALALTAASESERIFGLARHPAKSGKSGMVSTETRAHTTDEDPRDEDQPARGRETHKKIRAIIEANPHLFTDGKGREGASSGSQSYPLKSGAQREAGQRRAEGGHGGRGGRSLGDLASGSAWTLSGR